jgi:hypothetical protein
MSSNPLARVLTVDLFVYPSTINILSKTEDQLKSEAREIIKGINSRVCTNFRTFSVNLATLEICNSRFSEKQVSRIDDNFCYYSYGRRLPLDRSSFRAPKGANCLVKKTFSGDVSGEIGESLFTYFLLTEMGVDSSEISHLRPGKKAAFLVPDFVIYDGSYKLSSLVRRTNYRIPLLVEVKGFTGSMDPGRIYHALEQLKLLIGSSYTGLVFLAARNQQRRRYDAYVLRVEK